MNPEVEEEARKFVGREAASDRHGRTADTSSLSALNIEMGGRIPEWYQSLLTTVPLCGLEIDWRTEDLDVRISWNDVNGIRSESVECYPGLAILDRGFINVGSDPIGNGDPYFIPTDQGDDPPVFLVYHDVSDQADEILANGLVQIVPRLSALFRQASI